MNENAAKNLLLAERIRRGLVGKLDLAYGV